jgi:hypothetical protein
LQILQGIVRALKMLLKVLDARKGGKGQLRGRGEEKGAHLSSKRPCSRGSNPKEGGKEARPACWEAM